ncbi:hypothetical protein SLEP1_g5475 [Rubroshorea leprosula]|uniref:Photosystem II protein I n=1 Tax=Rubroshorea leprosula TaxID=152421 RepID=A0AAV5I1W4_9ROSI|nr:hypothetical protein SLEP1_g5475 [Rubroshorea leprosula]
METGKLKFSFIKQGENKKETSMYSLNSYFLLRFLSC